jgi:hypothetical protein
MSIDAIPAELSSRFDKLLARYDEWWAQADEATEAYDEVNKINNVVPKARGRPATGRDPVTAIGFPRFSWSESTHRHEAGMTNHRARRRSAVSSKSDWPTSQSRNRGPLRWPYVRRRKFRKNPTRKKA